MVLSDDSSSVATELQILAKQTRGAFLLNTERSSSFIVAKSLLMPNDQALFLYYYS
jgi:hypothetical protein